MTRLRTIVVDDEEPARELLHAFLGTMREIQVVGDAGDGNSALALIQHERPDLVFLDVQMPGMNGIDIAASLASLDEPPLVVFVTAFDRYAIKAFEVSACDYLLKPFDAERLGATVRRVVARRSESPATVARALRALMTNRAASACEPVVVKTEGRHVFLEPDDIEWIEAIGKELRIYAGNSIVTARESMNSIEARLDASRFVRVQRSAIVNRAQIREVQPWFKGDYVLILRGGTRVVSGPTYRPAVQALLAGR